MRLTQTQWILEALRKGPLTAQEAQTGCSCWRLAARIKDLRLAGYDIATRNRTLPSGKTIGVYHLMHQRELFNA
jgi:hypothetical protein